MNTGSQYNTSYDSQSNRSDNQSNRAADLTDAVVDTMVRWPMRVTGATVDFMLQGVRQMTGGGGNSGSGSGNYSSSSSSTYGSGSGSSSQSGNTGSNSGFSSLFSNQSSGTFDQDLSGDDLKYVIWSIVFTKPGYECILQKQQEELVNYAADSSTYAAVKIAKFLDSARHGHSEKPEDWRERGYPSEPEKTRARKEKESTTIITTPSSTTVASSVGAAPSMEARNQGTVGNDRERRDQKESGDKGWRIPAEDQKYITFLYKVERRLQKQEETTRVERVTVERNTRVV
jgi:hypothetical protein